MMIRTIIGSFDLQIVFRVYIFSGDKTEHWRFIKTFRMGGGKLVVNIMTITIMEKILSGKTPKDFLVAAKIKPKLIARINFHPQSGWLEVIRFSYSTLRVLMISNGRSIFCKTPAVTLP